MNHKLFLSGEVAAAIRSKTPVVALESTIISHGMPYPQNVATATAVEKIIRDRGAIPATIAVLKGKVCVGLSPEHLEDLGKAEGVWKVSLRDLPYVVQKKLHGATTVAATMRIAAMAGIPVFVTGGIGGVHHGAAATFDISADLTEMAQTSVAIVSAGVKSILDVPATLEYLETQGVPVISYGQNEFPCFYSAMSPYRSPLRMDSPEDIAELLKTKWDLDLKGAVLIANPVPPEDEIPFHHMEEIIRRALNAADENKVQGKDITPFLLRSITAATSGKSLQANISLVKNNAVLGADVALAFSALQ